MKHFLRLGATALFVLSSSISASSLTASDTFGDATPPPKELKPGFETITEEQSEEWLSILVGDGFDGRGTGQEGYVRAAAFVAGKLSEFGFQPMGENGTYFQNLPFFKVTPDVEASSISLGDIKITGEDALGFTSFSDSVRIEGNLVIINAQGEGARIENPDVIRDKVVLVQEKDTDRRFAFALARSGAKAVIQISDKPTSTTQTVRDGGRFGGGGVSAEITKEAANKLAAAAGLDGVGKLDGNGVQIKSTTQNVTIDLKVVRQPMAVPNVVGWLEGSDPELKHEYVVIGGHLDHLGKRGDAIYPGADDNGSGSTAILQVAKALHENPVKPKRSVLYIAFAAEEMGLLGSAYFADNPTQPLENCVCMFNIDMVGRNEETDNEPASENTESIHLIGSQQYSSDLHKLMLECNKHVGFKFEYDEEERVFRRSDHYNFFKNDIPVAFVFGGFNPHYHQQSDGLNDINYEKIANCARLYYLAIHAVADHGPFERDKE